QTSRPVVVSFYAKPIQGTCRFCTVSGNRAVKHYSSTGLIKGDWKRYFISFPKGTAFNNTKRQGIVEFVYGRCRYALVKVEYGETPSKFDTNAEKLSSTYTIKTQAIAGNRKAIAGLTLGATIDGETVESSVNVLANNFNVAASENGTLQPLFTVQENKAVLAPQLIAKGGITTSHLAANSISADKIVSGAITADKLNVSKLSALSSNLGDVTAGTITGTTITGTTINGGVINGTTITGGTIRGTRLEGVTGVFKGSVHAENVIGSNLFDSKTYVVRASSSKRYTVHQCEQVNPGQSTSWGVTNTGYYPVEICRSIEKTAYNMQIAVSIKPRAVERYFYPDLQMRSSVVDGVSYSPSVSKIGNVAVIPVNTPVTAVYSFSDVNFDELIFTCFCIHTSTSGSALI
ncbi:DUF1983 domain-containing protein, partial [Pasteurella atlantica]